MLMSVDGKISTGATDELDVDRDFPKIPGVREGLINTTKSSRQQICGLLIPVGFRQSWVSMKKRCLQRRQYHLFYWIIIT